MAIFGLDSFTGANGALTGHTPETGGSWSVSPNGTGATLSSNQLALPSAATWHLQNNGTPANANYEVQADFKYAATTSNNVGLAVRVNSTTNTGYALIQYQAGFTMTPSWAGLIGATVNPSGGISTAETYRLILNVNGTTLTAYVQRLSDSQWMASNGAWQAGKVSFSSGTDSSIIAAGKAGFSGNNPGAATALVDNFTVSDLVTDTITVTDFPAKKVFQQVGTNTPITVSGTYVGTVTNVEARIVQHGTSTEVVTWSTLATGPTGGTFSGSINAPVSAGVWYNIQVRFSNNTSIVSNGANKWGVGELV